MADPPECSDIHSSHVGHQEDCTKLAVSNHSAGVLGRFVFCQWPYLLPGGLIIPASGDLAGRIAGLVIVCLALGCWPRASVGEDRQALAPLIALSLLAAVYLINIGTVGANVGVLLWPAAATHLILAILLARAWMKAG